MRNLVIGDPHSTPEELEDCEALMELAFRVANQYKVDVVTLTGDLHNNHDTVSTRCIEFWRRWILKLSVQTANVVLIKGNHDQVSPSEAYPHALLAYDKAIVVDTPILNTPVLGCGAMPYYYDPEAFIKDAKALKTAHPELHTLYCHQTFDGSRYENGFYAKDAVDPNRIPFDHIISGHIHAPQQFGKVLYVGSPRWRTLSDAGSDRHLWVLDHNDKNFEVVAKVATDLVCSRIWAFDDTPNVPAQIDSVPEAHRSRAQIRVKVYGPTPEYVREREIFLKAKYGALTRGFPTRPQRATVSESEGIDTAFSKFVSNFRAPNGTSVEVLLSVVEPRLHEAQK